MQRDEILVIYSLAVDKVPVVIVKIHWRNPLLLLRHNHPPDAAEAVQVDDKEEDKLVQLEEGLEFLSRA